MRYLDANVFIFAANAKGREGAVAAKVLRDTVSGRYPAVTAVLTLDEVAWAIRRLIDRETALRETTRILSLPHVTVLDVKPRHMVTALDLMERHPRLQPRDALHAAVAMDAGVYSIVSSDPDFDAIPELERVALEREVP